MQKRKLVKQLSNEKLKQIADLVVYLDGRLYNRRTGSTVDGTIQRGYRKVRVYHEGKYLQARAHRIIWYKFYGDIPEGLEVDHIDRVRCNNIIDNLRLLTRKDNARNVDGLGYYFNKKAGKWQAYIYLDNTHVHLGMFDSSTAARVAYLEAKRTQHPTYTHTQQEGTK